MLKYREIDFQYADIWRVFISGSSEAGKTYWTRQLLENNTFRYERVYYYHPDIQEEFPVDWKKHLTKPVIYQAGLPTESELLNIPKYSVVILDDLFAQACSVKHIDYLFRVLSSKKKIHCIIMTQRYFAEGDIGRSIRNSSNYHVLMTNADHRTNMRVASFMNAKKDVEKAVEINKNKMYPYIFIDQTKYARVSGIRIFTDIISRYKQAIVNSMPFYLVAESDFKAYFTPIENDLAVENASNQKNGKERNAFKNRSLTENKKKSKKDKKYDSSSSETSEPEDDYQSYIKRRRFEKQVGAALQRRKVRSKLQC